MEENKKEPRINNVSAILMIATAIVCDLLGPFGAVGAVVVFFIWFKVKKVPLISAKTVAKQLANLGLNAVGEALTVGVWAGVTVGVILTIVFSRLEDDLGISLDAKTLTHPAEAAGKIGERLSSPGGSTPKQGAPHEAGSPGKPQMNDVKPGAAMNNVIGGAERFQRPPAATTQKSPAVAQSSVSPTGDNYAEEGAASA